MTARLGIVARFRRAAKAARGAGCGSAHLSFFGVSFVDAVLLWAGGYQPHINVVPRLSQDGWRTYYDLQARIDDVQVVAFTVDRPALPHEIDAVQPPVVAPVVVEQPAPAVERRTELSRVQLLEID